MKAHCTWFLAPSSGLLFLTPPSPQAGLGAFLLNFQITFWFFYNGINYTLVCDHSDGIKEKAKGNILKVKGRDWNRIQKPLTLFHELFFCAHGPLFLARYVCFLVVFVVNAVTWLFWNQEVWVNWNVGAQAFLGTVCEGGTQGASNQYSHKLCARQMLL